METIPGGGIAEGREVEAQRSLFLQRDEHEELTVAAAGVGMRLRHSSGLFRFFFASSTVQTGSWRGELTLLTIGEAQSSCTFSARLRSRIE